MLAFNPGVVPPGLAASDDKLLQSRIFSYSDAQRYRCGVKTNISKHKLLQTQSACGHCLQC